VAGVTRIVVESRLRGDALRLAHELDRFEPRFREREGRYRLYFSASRSFDRFVVDVLTALEDALTEHGLDSVLVHVDEREYSVHRRAA
jgi:hypothetical protein